MFWLSRLQLLPRNPFIDTLQEPLVILRMKLLGDVFPSFTILGWSIPSWKRWDSQLIGVNFSMPNNGFTLP